MIPTNLSGLLSHASLTTAVLLISLGAWGAAPAHFLSHGPGAKALAMGEAFTSVADDPSAVYWNPAGILSQPPSLLMEHTPTLGGGRLNFLGGAMSSKKIAIGFGVYQYATDDVEARAAIGDGPTAIEVSQTAFYLPIAFTTSLGDMGVSLKRVENHFGSYHKAGQGVDAGFLKTMPLPKCRWIGHPILGVGFAARNVVPPTFQTSGETETYPREYSLGVSVEGQFRRVFNVVQNTRVSDSARLTVENVATSDDWVSPRVGGEYLYRHMLSIRAGYSDGITAGLGVWLLGQTLTVDYAMSVGNLDLEHKMSITYRFLSRKTRWSKMSAPPAPNARQRLDPKPENFYIPNPKTFTPAVPQATTPAPEKTPPSNNDINFDDSSDAPFENPFRWNLSVFPPKAPPSRKSPKHP